MAAFYLAEIVSAQAADIADNLDVKSAVERAVADGILDGKDELIFETIFTLISKSPSEDGLFDGNSKLISCHSRTI
ncbi:hypothetical protein AY606_13725 [Acinetobacter sp. SFB]|uniref:hypothetical protein n=1 Tax=Acinetobacter sp. SFB TaxID=1805634 RepID=UPI0007D8021D|nr:hypothetical protein [Acinetobacter sp. SFB]OAL75786.1 hypothetical protein AY606_13725 [Acinetobacter sp. SFB]